MLSVRQRMSEKLFRNGEMSKDQFLDEQFGESPDFAIGLDSGYISAIVKTLE